MCGADLYKVIKTVIAPNTLSEREIKLVNGLRSTNVNSRKMLVTETHEFVPLLGRNGLDLICVGRTKKKK